MINKQRTKEERSINRIILLSSSFIIILISFLLAYILIKLQIQEFDMHLHTFKNTLIQQKKLALKLAMENLKEDISYEQKIEIKKIKQIIKNQTTIAKKLIYFTYQENRDKRRDYILKKVKGAIQNISYDKEDINYFVFDTDGTMLLNTSQKKYEGKNFIDFIDLNDKKIVKEMITKTKLKDRFFKFLWYVPNSSKIKEKIIYVSYIKGLDIVVGSGRYINDKALVIKYILDKLKKRQLSKNESLFALKIGSLNDIQKYSSMLIKRGDVVDDVLRIAKDILIKSNYKGDIFYLYKDRLYYSYFFNLQRVFVSFSVDLKEINQIISNETKISNKNLYRKINTLIVSIIFLMVVFFMLSYFVATKIEKIFKSYRLKVLENERRYKLLFNHSNDGFIISKIVDKENSIIISANSLAKELSGYGSDLIGRDFFMLFDDIDKNKLINTKSLIDQVILTTKDNSRRNIELSCVLYEDGEDVLIFASLRDITERIKLKNEKNIQEKLLIQKSKMASMGEMIGNIAHQWRQPISQISSLFFDIESAYDYGELDKNYISKSVDRANDILEYMSKTIDDFKDFYNPNKKDDKFNLKDSINKTINIIGSSLKYHNIAISTKIDQDIDIKGNANEFSQVILNIINNAKDMAIQRGIKEPFIKIYTKKTDSEVSIYIEDNCGGIKIKEVDKIFEPYFTTKFNYGTGIGLYMSKIIIENKMEGKIVVVNQENIGATFVLTLKYILKD